MLRTPSISTLFPYTTLFRSAAEALMVELRGKIPAPILGHYDRLVAQGKKGVAAVRNQVCTGCHMKVTLGVMATLMHGRSEEHTSELQSRVDLVCRLLLEKKK